MKNTFEWWLQGRLIAHGHRIRQDGVIGGETKTALVAFQRSKHLRQTGVADKMTVDMLRMTPQGRDNVATPKPPAETMPPWMAEMHRKIGLHEKRDNAVLSAWLRIGKFLGDPAKLPWCGDAVETAIVKTLPFEAVPNNPFWAQDWRNFGIGLDGPKVGAIGVIRWANGSGHVGFVADWDATRICMLGGNQSDSINLTWFNRSVFIAYRWPKTFDYKVYPPLRGNAGSGSLAGTR